MTGKYTYVHNVRVPGMLHGRIVRPRGQGAYGVQLERRRSSVDESSIAHIPGAQVVQGNNFLGVVAPKEYDAIQAAAQLKVVVEHEPDPAGHRQPVEARTRRPDCAGTDAGDRGTPREQGNVDAALASAAKVVSAHLRVALPGPHADRPELCGRRRAGGRRRLIITRTRRIGATTSTTCSRPLELPPTKIRVHLLRGLELVRHEAGYDDAAESAAIMSKAVGKPVRLQMMRWDEHGWDAHGPATLYDMRAGVDAKRQHRRLRLTTSAPGRTAVRRPRAGRASRPGQRVAPVATHHEPGPDLQRPATERLTGKSMPLYKGIFQACVLRAPGARRRTSPASRSWTCWRYAAKMDSLAFRLQNIDRRAAPAGCRCCTRLAQAARLEAVGRRLEPVGRQRRHRPRLRPGSHGARHAAAVADIEVNKKTGKIVVTHLYARRIPASR